jgi:hypothetical protein
LLPLYLASARFRRFSQPEQTIRPFAFPDVSAYGPMAEDGKRTARQAGGAVYDSQRPAVHLAVSSTRTSSSARRKACSLHQPQGLRTSAGRLQAQAVEMLE